MNHSNDTVAYYRNRAQQMRDRARLFTGTQANLYDEAGDHFERLAESLAAARRALLN